jgi:hypothetical protein
MKRQTRYNGYAVYYLLDPRTMGPRYVGYSKHPYDRYGCHCKNHIKNPRLDSHKIRWIKSLQALGLQPVLSIRGWFEKEEAKHLEATLIIILRARGVDLTNTAPGGTGGDTFTSNIHNEETREKHRQNAINRYKDPEWRRRTGDSVRGCVRDEQARANYRKAWDDPERKRKNGEMASLLHKGKKKSPEHIANIIKTHVGMLGHRHSEESKAKMRESWATKRKQREA